MHPHPRIPTFLLVVGLSSACTLEQGLGPKEEDPEAGETGDSPDVDTAETGDSGEPAETAETGETGPVETGDTAPPDTGACADQELPEMEAPETSACPRAVTPRWELETVWKVSPPGRFYGTPVAGPVWDENGDGVVNELDPPGIPLIGGGPEKSNYVALLDARDGTVRWTTASMPMWDGGTPLIADVDGDGTVEIVYMNWLGNRALNGEDGSTQWVNFSRSLGEFYRGAPAIVDMDADGSPEILYGALLLDAFSGSVLYGDRRESYGSGYAEGGACPMSIAADLDDDGVQEMVLGPNAVRMDGTMHLSRKGDDGYPAVGEFDGDRYPEIVVTRADEVCLYDDDGTELWCATILGAPWGAAPPVVADLDGDGQVEIVVSGFQWQAAFDAVGNQLWVDDRTTGSPMWDVLFDGVSAYDLDADGTSEVLVSSATGFRILHGASGTTLAEFPTEPAWVEGQIATVIDADGDGEVEILYSHWDAYDVEQTLYLFRDVDGFAAGRRVWNQHAFTESVIHDDLSVPSPAPDVWRDDGAFRAAGLGQRDGDLAVQVRAACSDACVDGELSVWFSLVNHTSAEVTGPLEVEVTVHDARGGRLATTYTWSDPLPPLGATAGHRIDLTGLTFPVYDVTVQLVGARDCDPDNDHASTGEIRCE